MRPHYFYPSTETSPFSRKPSTKSHDRGPPRQHQPSADVDRQKMMENAEDCTILTTFRKFLQKHVPRDLEGFNERFPLATIETISRALRLPLQSTEDEKIHSRIIEKNISAAWADVDREHCLCPGFFLHLSENTPEDGDTTKSKVDASLIPDCDRSSTVPKVPNWALQRYTIEFKRGGTGNDPFDDKNIFQPESASGSRRHVRGQLFSYADRIFKYQHRTAHFMLLVNGSVFRIMRWDRSGVIVSEAVEYAKTTDHTRVLLELLFGLSKMSLVGAGLDPTATRLSPTSCGWQRMQVLSFASSLDLNENEVIQKRSSDRAVNAIRQTYRAATAPTSGLFTAGKLHKDPRSLCSGRASSNVSVKESFDEALSNHPPTFKYIRDLFRESLKSKIMYVLTVQKQDYLVGSPVYSAMGPIGRGTRGFVALEWDSQRFVFLKDSWRPFYVDVGIEGNTLKILNDAGITCVPTLVCYEDLSRQVTLTSQYSPRTSTRRPQLLPIRKLPPRAGSYSTAARRPEVTAVPAEPITAPPAAVGTKRSYGESQADRQKLQGWGLRHLTHSRIVVAEVCLPLTAYPNGRTLLRVLDNAVYAHQEAFEKCNIIHRDVSAGNILIFPVINYLARNRCFAVSMKGLLSDWELAKIIVEKTFATQPQRTGTWQYMSVPCLLYPEKAIEIPDELEAFFNVLLYDALRFMRHNFNLTEVHSFFLQYFDGSMITENGEICGMMKMNSIQNAKLALRDKHLRFGLNGNHPFNDLVSSMLVLFQSRLKVYEWKRSSTLVSNEGKILDLEATSLDLEALEVAALEEWEEQEDGPTQVEDPASTPADATPVTPSTLQKPSDEDFARDESLKTHKHFRDLIAGCLRGAPLAKWPADRAAFDQMVGYNPDKTVETMSRDAKRLCKSIL